MTDKIVTEVARSIYESIFADSFDGTRGAERAQYVQAARAAITAMSTAQEPALDDDAEWLRQLCSMTHLYRADKDRLRAIANRLQAKAPEAAQEPALDDDALAQITARGNEAVQALINMPVGDRSPTRLINRKEALTLLESYQRDVERIAARLQAKAPETGE